MFASNVAPHVGAGVEIRTKIKKTLDNLVAPHVGAGVEIDPDRLCSDGLQVAPHVGAGVEIEESATDEVTEESHLT